VRDAGQADYTLTCDVVPQAGGGDSKPLSAGGF